MSPLSRRTFMVGTGAAAGALLLRGRGGLPGGLLADAVGGPTAPPTPTLLPRSERTAARASRLFDDRTFLAHADLHNHSHLSDGAGDPARAFASMREAGLDVAALTDHAVMSWGTGEHDACAGHPHPAHGQEHGCRSLAGIDERGWRRTAELADAADDPGHFVAVRGFEWSSSDLGHANVWFSERWIDPAQSGGLKTARLADAVRDRAGDRLAEVIDALPQRERDELSMRGLYDWLARPPGIGRDGGGGDGLASFNHPGRESGRFDRFAYDPRVAERFVAMEILNRDEDHLFKGFGDDRPSPLVECLNAGWRTGLLGVTDEHSGEWGHLHGLGRSGLWVSALTRRGVRDALAQRRVFATFTRGLRLDVAARSQPAGSETTTDAAAPLDRSWQRMGSVLEHRSGPVEFVVDIDRGGEWIGRRLDVQVLRPDTHQPSVAHVEEIRVPSPSEPLPRFSVDLDVEDGEWVVLRIADPDGRNAHPGPDGHAGNRDAIAYASPFWLAA